MGKGRLNLGDPQMLSSRAYFPFFYCFPTWGPDNYLLKGMGIGLNRGGSFLQKKRGIKGVNRLFVKRPRGH